MFILRKTLLNPSTKIPSSPFHFSSRFFSNETNFYPFTKTPKRFDTDIPTSAFYDKLIDEAGRSRDHTTLYRLLNKRYKDGCFNTSKTFKFLTETNAHFNTDLDDLVHIICKVDKGFARKNAFDCLITCLCKSDCVNESVRVIESMIEKEVGVNAVTFWPLLNTLTRKRRIDEAWGVVEKMREYNVCVDITAYNFILMGHCFEGDMKKAVEVLEKILEQGLKVDTRTYDALVMGACRAGKVEGALLLLRKMEEEGVRVLYCTHVHVITSLLGMGCFKLSFEFVMAFAGRDKALDKENFGFLLNCLIKRRRVEEAKLVFFEMEDRGLAMGEKLKKEYEGLLLGEFPTKNRNKKSSLTLE
ncbi:hypothetical protein IFM89_012236 [Coptis chinensis]|uniref:Pentatricopeptide repeat-containing protein-mitochondrial domain-containing protein n=1 Tax=Coptis chinensis TaxID=261450 RepID=A0A835HCE4_9MAGN|nr:hypothetical protein IFM89_012236 [Coptis chinensis]